MTIDERLAVKDGRYRVHPESRTDYARDESGALRRIKPKTFRRGRQGQRRKWHQKKH